MLKKLKFSKPDTKNSVMTYAGLVIAFVLFSVLSAAGALSSMMKDMLVPLCVYAILAVSLNLTVGILGELSLGQAGFMCIGAYSGALFSYLLQDTIPVALVRFPLAMIIGGVFAAFVGIVIGIPVLRLRGDYLAIVTLAFGEIIKNITGSVYLGRDASGFHFSLKDQASMNMDPDGELIISGALGINGTPNDSNFVIAFIVLLITTVVAYNFVNSRTGRAVMSIRDNRIASESVGINVTKYKLITFALTAFFAGVAGSLYSHNFSTLQASKFDYNLSILVLVFVVLGGIGSIRGSIIASVLLTLIPELLRSSIGKYRMLIYAVILIVMMIVNNGDYFINLKEKLSVKVSSKIKKDKKEVV